MKFALLIRGSSDATALAFIRAAMAQDHVISQVFFQGDGVHVANRLAALPPGEPNPAADWSQIAAESGIDLVLCSTAGLRRGVREANLAPGFRISGVGQWLEAAIAADRILQFGG